MRFHPDIEMRLFEASDAFSMVLRSEDLHVARDPHFKQWVEANALGAGFTGVRKSDGKILGCGGIKVISSGVGEAWALFCDEIGRYAKECKEYAHHYLGGLAKKMSLQRLQCIVYADEKLKVRYAKALGFEAEGTMRRYKEGRDCVIFALNPNEIDLLSVRMAPTKFSLLSPRDKIQVIEDTIMEQQGAMMGDCFPLKHEFAQGLYVREIRVPATVLLTGKIHKNSHAFFLQEGDISVLMDGGWKRIKAPAHFITPAGTKRAVYHHSDTVVVTVHATDETDIAKIEDEIIATDRQNAPRIGGIV